MPPRGTPGAPAKAPFSTARLGTPPPPFTPGGAVTILDALSRAQANEPAFALALAASRAAQLDRKIARSALLPQATYHNQFLYTQPAQVLNRGVTGNAAAGSTTPRFVANNAVHEYVSQGVVTETIGLAQTNALARANSAAAIADAEVEISRRGLTATVLNLFYAVDTAAKRIAVEQRAETEATSFVTLTGARETAREAAHADVIKAQLTAEARQRDRLDAELALERARLDLAVLLFPDPRTPYTLTLPAAKPLPSRAEVETALAANNPELASALATLRSRSLEITAARAGYLPDLALGASYGIDASQFAITSSTGERNLGYSASATLDIPVFDWFATHNRVEQARVLRDAAQVNLNATQRGQIARLDETYAEATLAQKQLDSLHTSVTTATESLRLTRLRYTAGEATVLEVVDAQNTLTAAELALTDGGTRFQLALASLQLLTGTI